MSQGSKNRRAGDWATEKFSTRVLYVLVGVAAVVFALFWGVGFDRPFDEDPNFNAPLLTDVLLWLMCLMLFGALALGAWSMARALKVRGKGDGAENNIPTKRIGYAVAFGTLCLLVLTFALGSSAPMAINGNRYGDAFWLKASDMFIYSAIFMMAVAALAVAYGATRYIRK